MGAPVLGKNFGDPTIDNALAVCAGIGIVDGEDLCTFEHLGKTSLGLHLRVRRYEIDLVLGKEALHRGTRCPVDQLLTSVGVLGTPNQGDRLRGRSDALLRKADDDVVALSLGVERVDNEEDAP